MSSSTFRYPHAQDEFVRVGIRVKLRWRRFGIAALLWVIALVGASLLAPWAGGLVLLIGIGVSVLLVVLALANLATAHASIELTESALRFLYPQLYPRAVVERIRFDVPWSAVTSVTTSEGAAEVRFVQASLLGGGTEGRRIVYTGDPNAFASLVARHMKRDDVQKALAIGPRLAAPTLLQNLESYRTFRWQWFGIGVAVAGAAIAIGRCTG